MDSQLKDILGSGGQALAGRRLVLAISGSIAAIECPRLARTLMREGADVHVVMSRQAARLLHPTAMEWCTGNAVVTRLSGRVEHIALAGRGPGHADVVLLAPATANSISKIALGIDDTPVTTVLSTALGAGLPIVMAPGMHEPMLNHPAVQENLQRLKRFGVHLVVPTMAEDKAKMAPIDAIVEAVIEATTLPTLQGRRILITAGPTIEYIDPIRTLTNSSSGRMGVALAREARRRGGQVTLVYGPGQAPVPAGVAVVTVRTTAEMLEAVQDVIPRTDIALFAAAVADYTVLEPAAAKLATADGPITLRLDPTPKIIDRARALAPAVYMVGFKAETPASTAALIDIARTRLTASRLQLMIANRSSNFGTDDGEVYIVDGEQDLHLGPAPKASLARGIWDEIVCRLQ